MLKSKIENTDRLISRLAGLSDGIVKEVRAEIFLLSKEVESDAKISIQRGPKTGLIYKRKNVSHRASAPGEAPATDTGSLVSSITHGQVDVTGFVYEVGTNSKYAKPLEFGTRKMASRPFLQPALEKNKKPGLARIKRSIQKVAKNVSRKLP